MTEEKKRDYTKFFTPIEVADFMVDILDPQPGEWILEPHAGNGALVKRVKAKCPEAVVTGIELYEQWRSDLENFCEIVVIKDFLQTPTIAKWCKCIANPPFGNGIDLISHFNKMKECVKKGGKIVMLVPEDFDPDVMYVKYPIENWSTNSDGTTTPIKIIEFYNP
jgi:16S rRNA A1518/A1519 N6-dimethyltransferase RsmA/KsgA/DIM1 with predicted DNA glycosylase/AP lyase activity